MGASEKQTHDLKLVGNRAVDCDANDRVLSYGKSATAKRRMDMKRHGSATTTYEELDASADQIETVGLDVKNRGAIATAYRLFDTSANEMRNYGPIRMTSQRTCLSNRFELVWVAGQRGKPALNGDIALDENSNAAAHLASNIADPDFELLGTNAVSGSSAFYAEGGIALVTAGAADDQVILLPHLDTNQTAWTGVTWGTDKQTEWECDLTTGANITNVIIWAGLKLTNTPTVATDNDSVFFRYEDDVNSGKWQTNYSIGGNATTADAGVAAVAINTRYHLKITIDSSRIARMYVNGTLAATSTALTDATDLIPYIGIENDGGAGAAKTLRVHGQAISRVIG